MMKGREELGCPRFEFDSLESEPGFEGRGSKRLVDRTGQELAKRATLAKEA